MSEEHSLPRTPDPKSPLSKQRSNYIWKIDTSQEEILLKSTSSSSIKKNKIRHLFCISPTLPRRFYSIDSSPNIIGTDILNPSLSSPLLAKYSSSDFYYNKFLQSSPLRNTIQSPVKRSSNVISIGSKADLLELSIFANNKVSIDEKLPTSIKPKIKDVPITIRKRKKSSSELDTSNIKIKHKDQAIVHILLKISDEWATDFFFVDFLHPELKMGGVAIEIVPKEHIHPFKAVLFRKLDKYSEAEKLFIELDPRCRKCDVCSNLLLDAGCPFLIITPDELYKMKIDGVAELLENYSAIDDNPTSYYCPIHRRNNLILVRPQIEGGGKKKKSSIVFPDLEENVEKESIREIMLELQMKKMCQILDWSIDSYSSLAVMIAELIRVVAFEPFRKKERGEPLTSSGRKGKDQTEILKKILLLINGVSESVASAISKKWDTLGGLIGYLRHIELKEGYTAASFSLAKINVQRLKSIRTIGETLSQRIFKVLMGDNPLLKIN